MPPRPPVIHEARYEAVLTALGLAKLPVSDRINALLTMSSEELVGKIGMSIPLHPVVDGDIISQAINFDAVARKDNSMRAPGMHWCQDLFIGNCQMDVCSSTISVLFTILSCYSSWILRYDQIHRQAYSPQWSSLEGLV